MNKNLNFPQFGVVTSCNSNDKEAKVYIPRYAFETDYIKVSKEIPFKTKPDVEGLDNGSQVVVTFIDGDLGTAIVTSWV